MSPVVHAGLWPVLRLSVGLFLSCNPQSEVEKNLSHGGGMGRGSSEGAEVAEETHRQSEHTVPQHVDTVIHALPLPRVLSLPFGERSPGVPDPAA